MISFCKDWVIIKFEYTATIRIFNKISFFCTLSDRDLKNYEVPESWLIRVRPCTVFCWFKLITKPNDANILFRSRIEWVNLCFFTTRFRLNDAFWIMEQFRGLGLLSILSTKTCPLVNLWTARAEKSTNYLWVFKKILVKELCVNELLNHFLFFKISPNDCFASRILFRTIFLRLHFY